MVHTRSALSISIYLPPRTPLPALPDIAGQRSRLWIPASFYHCAVTFAERLCKYPGCETPAAASAGPGRAPSYCDNPAHTRTSAFAERRRVAVEKVDAAPGEGTTGADPQLLTEAAQRMDDLVTRFTHAATTINDLGGRILADLELLGDPDTVIAEISAIRAESGAAIAVAQARATQEEHAARTTRAALRDREQELSRVRDEIVAARADLDHKHIELETVLERERELTQIVDDVTRRAETAEQAAELAQRQAHENAHLAESEKAGRLRAEQQVEHWREAAGQERERARVAGENAAALQTDLRAMGERAVRAEAAAESGHRLAERYKSERDTVTQERAVLRAQLTQASADTESVRRELTAAVAHAEDRLVEYRADAQSRIAELRADAESARQEARDAQQKLTRLSAQLEMRHSDAAVSTDAPLST